MLRWSCSVGFSVAAAIVCSTAFAADDQRDASLYVGVKMCGICHKKDESGNQLAIWEKSAHARAYDMLGKGRAKASAAKLGISEPQKSGKCLKCHSTAYNFTETVQSEKVKVEDGVVCESCHGPGKNYMKKSVMQNREDAIKAGLVYPASKSCLNCHNDKSPTWNPERYTTKDGKKVGFDFEQAFEKIKHPDPQVKH